MLQLGHGLLPQEIPLALLFRDEDLEERLYEVVVLVHSEDRQEVGLLADVLRPA